MTLPDDFVFSQSSLQDFVDCARRFELRYIEKMRYPSVQANPPLVLEQHIRLGDRFHKMAQQYFAGVPAQALTQSVVHDENLSSWWDTFLMYELHDFPAQRYVETTLQMPLTDYRLIAKYDLVEVYPDGLVIIRDWKTSPRVTERRILAKRLQTRVYPYVLAQAGAHFYNGEMIPVDRIKMVYSFVAHGGHTVEFDYTAEQMEVDAAYISDLISDIAQANVFPLTSDTRKCKFCSYRSLCSRGEEVGQWDDFDQTADDELDSFDIDFDQIAEIEF